MVSAAFKDSVEEIEPGRHQFIPISVLDRQSNVQAGSFYIFNVIGQIDVIVEERSNLKPIAREFIEVWEYTRKEGPWRCAVYANRIAGRACWVEMRYGRNSFISDRLAALLAKRQLKGFGLDSYCEEI